MKIFKTILWTTFFWIVVVLALLATSYFYRHEAAQFVPKWIKSTIVDEAGIQFAELNGESNTEEVIIPEEIYPEGEIIDSEGEIPQEVFVENSFVDEVEPGDIDTSNNSLFFQNVEPTEPSVDVAALQNRVTVLEDEYSSLVTELQQIFATPALAQLLSQPAQEYVVEETPIE